ncbi:hypothetical protein HK101_004082 [Irineochytrium annulatum]|nr:hypothetical protein HK101_004082 [Irineochytrium annulatum]
MPTTDSDSARFTLRILGQPFRGRVTLSPPVAATAVDADADVIVSSDRATETKGTLVLLNNSWADLSLPLTFSLEPGADETPVNDPEQFKRIKDGWISFGYRALWCLGCIGVIFVSFLVCHYVQWNGPYHGNDGGVHASTDCDGICQYEMPAWWYKNVEVIRSGSHDAFFLRDAPSTIAASFMKNMTLDTKRSRWGWEDNHEVLVDLLQQGGEDFTFDVNLTVPAEPFTYVKIEMFDPRANTYLFQLTIKESGHYKAHVPEFNPVNGTVSARLRFTLGPYSSELATAQISASGETRKYDVSGALASCPAPTRVPIWRPCQFNAPDPFHSTKLIFQQFDGPVGSESSGVLFIERPRIAAIVSQYVPMGLIILAALVTLAFVLWNRRTPVEAWREKRAKKDVGTEEEREPMLGEDV